MYKALKVTINSNSKIAKHFKVFYKGKEISVAITEIQFYIVDDNYSSALAEIIKNSYVSDAWKMLDKTTVKERLKNILDKKSKRKHKHNWIVAKRTWLHNDWLVTYICKCGWQKEVYESKKGIKRKEKRWVK